MIWSANESGVVADGYGCDEERDTRPRMNFKYLPIRRGVWTSRVLASHTIHEKSANLTHSPGEEIENAQGHGLYL